PGGSAHSILKFVQEAEATLRVRIPSVRKGVYKHILEALPMGGFKYTDQVAYVRMDATIRNQSNEVECPAGRFRVVECSCKDGVLVNDPPRTDVHVTHFRVPHLALGEAYGQPGRFQFAVGIAGV